MERAKIFMVKVDLQGCSRCGTEIGYTVVGPDGVEESAIYHDRCEAEEIAESLNLAYEQENRRAAA